MVKETTPVSEAVATELPTRHPQRHPRHSCKKWQAGMGTGTISVSAAVATMHPTHHAYRLLARCSQKHTGDNYLRSGWAVLAAKASDSVRLDPC